MCTTMCAVVGRPTFSVGQAVACSVGHAAGKRRALVHGFLTSRSRMHETLVSSEIRNTAVHRNKETTN